ncbi:MAG: hypothetical protein JXA16_05320 [Bacteroidales bacterium]|nr:hypothetical protein [Bacteroidales bacterium]
MKQISIKLTLILLINISLLNSLKSQFLNDEFCGAKESFNLDLRKKPWKGNNLFLSEYLKKINYYADIEKIRYRVPLKLWIYRKSDGSGGVSDEKIKDFIDNLNDYNKINNTGFRYYLREIENIDKSNKLTLGYFLEAPWQNIINHSKGCLNVYVTDTLKRKSFKKRRVNVRGTYNVITQSVIIQKSTSNTGLSHEIGHYFGLYHPHRNYRAGKRLQECVSRTRKAKGLFKKGLICERNGDGLSDTPAEPNLTFLVDNDCNFIGTSLKDKWGEKYQSSTSNIMSYPTHYKCRNSFTYGQIAVMLYKASKNKYQKYWNTENTDNLIYSVDEFEPDDNRNMANILEHAKIQEHSFHSVYTPKKKLDIADKEDWMKFKIEESSEGIAVITIKSSEKKISQINLIIENEKQKIIKQETISAQNREITINLNNLSAGWYYVKAEKTNIIQTKELDKYTIETLLR